MDYHFSNDELQLLYMLAKFLLSTPAILGTSKDSKAKEDAAKGTFYNPDLPNSSSASIDPECQKLFAELFLGTEEKISLIPAQYKDKPNFVPNKYNARQDLLSDIFTRPSLTAAHSFINMFEALTGKIRQIDQLAGVKGDGNLIALGSPTSNFLARVALGYEEIAGGTTGARYVPRDAFDLKIRYALDEAEILALDSVHQYIKRDEPSGDQPDVLNWGVKRSNGQVILPETRDGALLQDYLVISCLPNTFNKDSYQAGHRLLSLGGTHREGTKAIEQLFTNKGILEELHESLQVDGGRKANMPYWQALILVNSNPATGSVALNNILEVCPVEIHEPALEKLVQANHQTLMNYGAKS